MLTITIAKTLTYNLNLNKYYWKAGVGDKVVEWRE